MAIQSFGGRDLEEFFLYGRVGKGLKWSSLKDIVRRKLDMIHYAACLSDLRSPPGNRLEALRGELAGNYSIRVNDQWRVVFKWSVSGPSEVRIVDYH